MAEHKKSPLKLVLVLFLAIAIVIAVGFYERATSSKQQSVGSVSETVSESTKAAVKQTPQDTTQQTTAEEPQAIAAPPPPSLTEEEVQKLGKPRIIGNPNAPIKISEHSSFTCPACALFHKENFKKIKKDYIDTNKAYVVYDDFPRNQPDVLIGAIARCLPEQSYFNFIQVLFETQKDWLELGNSYIDHIKNTALFAGGDANKIEQCIQSTELHEILAQGAQNANTNHNVTGTPTLVINDKTTISGLSPYIEIKKVLDSALAQE